MARAGVAPVPAELGTAARPYGVAARQLAAAGLAVHSWVVLAHNSRMGLEHPQTVVRNAYGDRYPWAPCIARPEAVEYCATLAAEAAVRADTAGTELESCGWYGLAHLHAHDKISGVELGGAGQYLMSLCFCSRCESAYTAAGAPGTAAAVRAALEPLWRANGALDGSGEARGGRERSEWEQVERLLGPKLARLTLAHRTAATRAFQAACIAAVRAAAGAGFRILVHADPVSHRSGPNPGSRRTGCSGRAERTGWCCRTRPSSRSAGSDSSSRSAKAFW